MEYICLAYDEKKGLGTMSESAQNAAKPQTPRNPTILRCKNGLAKKELRAARHAAEFAVWQASGGDFLRSGLAK